MRHNAARPLDVTAANFMPDLRAMAPHLLLLLAAGLLAARPEWVALHLGSNALRWSPWVILPVCMSLALYFNRSRIFFAALSLVLVLFIDHQILRFGSAAHAVYFCMAIALLINLAIYSCLKERGLLTPYGLLRLALPGLEAAITSWLVFADQGAAHAWLMNTAISGPISAAVLFSWPACAVALLCLAVVIGRMVYRPHPVHAALTGTLLAAIFCLNAPPATLANSLFAACAGLMMVIAILLDSWHMAFRDELTGILSRRAMNDHLMRLGRHYVIAMVDVDHFKKFNDTYGHDAGDEVLKMVAARLNEVGGRGKAYRYGGEEFAIIFPRTDLEDALDDLEDVRAAIADYPFAIRSALRQPARRGSGREQEVQVTVSIGAACRSSSVKTPEQVIQAADQALYKAKERGRNQVCKAQSR